MNLMTLAAIRCDWFTNVISSRIEKPHSLLFYLIESADWVIRQVGIDITTNLNNQKLLKAKMTVAHRGVYNQVVHFGSVNTFLTSEGFRRPHKSNKVVLTWFHVVPGDPRIKFVKEAQKYVDVVHAASTITKEKLTEIGIAEEKIVVIPLGVDLSLFKPVSTQEKQKLRKKLGIPKDKVVVGSFQKDGVGWGEGLEPKLIKGPDIFVRVVERLAKNYPIFVLLVGPARGYVKLNLEKKNIPHGNVGYLKDFKDVAKYYRALDLYLITARIEGGPKALLEAMATGIPIISTKVGMVEDTVKDGKEALLAEAEDVQEIIKKSIQIIENENLRNILVGNSLTTIQNYSWEKIARRYFEEIYSNL